MDDIGQFHLYGDIGLVLCNVHTRHPTLIQSEKILFLEKHFSCDLVDLGLDLDDARYRFYLF
jgi:hypothetical protein